VQAAANRPGLGRALVAGAALGFAFGVLYPTTHVAIEPAQLLAGLVEYPPDNAFGIYETRVWTALHQLLAVPLALGVGERTLSIAVSGGVGALSFASLSAFAFALGAPVGWAAVTPFLLWAMNPVGWGFGYPILLVGHPHTYGMVGLAWALLACGVIGAGRFQTGAALLGFAPALHASVGASVAMLVGFATLLGGRAMRPHWPALLRGVAIGAGFAGLSLAAHLLWRPAVPAPDPNVVDPLFSTFLRVWEWHRQPLEWIAWRTWALVLGVAIAGTWLWRVRVTDATQALLLRVVLLGAFFGVLFALSRHAAVSDLLPDVVISAMPARILNLPVVAFLPLAVAALVRPGAPSFGIAAAVALAGIALFWQRLHALQTWGIPLVGIAALASAALPTLPGAAISRMRRIAAGAAVVAIVVGIGFVATWSARSLTRRLAIHVRDRSDDAVLAETSRRAGLLAVAPGIERAQSMTRRPIVIDPQALDMVTYAPAALPEMVRAIETLYGIPFASPRPEDRNQSVLPAAHVQEIWEARSAEEWAAVAAAFGVTDVLVPASWRLQIPELMRNQVFALHRVAASPP
jgi:hypothetical protein